MNKLRIVLVDDHAILRAGLKLLIDAQADMEVVGQAENGREAVRLAKELQPDVIVMDISMSELGGAEATELIKHEHTQVCVLALTRHADQGHFRQMMHAGAAGLYWLLDSA